LGHHVVVRDIGVHGLAGMSGGAGAVYGGVRTISWAGVGRRVHVVKHVGVGIIIDGVGIDRINGVGATVLVSVS